MNLQRNKVFPEELIHTVDPSILVQHEMAEIDAMLTEKMRSPVGPIPRVGAHLLGAGGKRLRPLLAVLAARATDASIAHATAVGVAAEMIHTATLFHDDVVDDGRVRRGRPAARMVYGNGIVVLVGDFCLARALETVAETGVLALVQSLAATVREMAEGEVAQLEGAGNPDATVADYFSVIDRKTASLIAWCTRVGGAVAAEQNAGLDRYGRAMGRAFQIADDILDFAIDEATAGKSVGHDLMEGKLTLPALLACDTDSSLRRQIKALMGERGVSEDNARILVAAVNAAGGVQAARKQARSLAAAAVADLQVLPESPYRDALVSIAHLAVDRVR
ncbi:MAG: polyprenyl synthetase family protein [Deltaproteobacteria bacterium]|nr:polyprenyl synthetase family protein [Deltaproteobacteria bacterium]